MNGKILSQIQHELKAPKAQFNKFGNYKYRSCEDIIEAAKPVLAKHNVALTLTDELVMVGDRVYVKATASLMDDNGNSISTTAYAREEETKKGMDSAQITGSCSSYARKYALSGLLALDDTKDPDTMDNREQGKPNIEAILKKAGVPIESFLQYYRINNLQEMTPDRYEHFAANQKAVLAQMKGA